MLDVLLSPVTCRVVKGYGVEDEEQGVSQPVVCLGIVSSGTRTPDKDSLHTPLE